MFNKSFGLIIAFYFLCVCKLFKLIIGKVFKGCNVCCLYVQCVLCKHLEVVMNVKPKFYIKSGRHIKCDKC